MARDTASSIFPHTPLLPTSVRRCLLQTTESAPSTMAIDADREQAVKDALNIIGHWVGVFREYDEPNENFSARLVHHLKRLDALFGRDGG